jgi:hypothetical protein
MTPVLGIIASSNQQGRGGGPVGSYDALATVFVPSGGSASVTFASIPAGYQHLQIRLLARTANAATYGGLRLQVGNGSIDTGSNYNTHDLYSDGTSSLTASSTTPNTNIYAGTVSAASLTANVFGAGIVDILDYANPNKFKTVRALGGTDANGSGYLYYSSGTWRSLLPITTLNFFSTSGNFTGNSEFALYGVK